MRNSETRRATILTIIERTLVDSQRALVKALRKRGIRVSQATVSRDIRDLGLVKVRGRYTSADAGQPTKHQLRQRVVKDVLEIRPASGLVVLVTPPGEAESVAKALDELTLKAVVGSVAGEDTIVVAVQGKDGGAALKRQLGLPDRRKSRGGRRR